MASNHGNSHSEPAKMEQIITEFFAKSLHIVLESRCPYVSSRNYSGEQLLSSPSSSTSSTSSIRPRDKWFNLALKDCPAALENIDFWRQSNLEPMFVDIVLVKRSFEWDPLNTSSPKRGLIRNSSDQDEFKREKIIERWIVQYESKKNVTSSSSSGNKRLNCATSSSTVYKKSILLLRSLYVMVRLLPAYKVFRDLMSSPHLREYNLCHRITSFVEPFTRKEESQMQKFVFSPVETSFGRLSLSVTYRLSILDGNSEPSTPMSPQFIQDYVGSPMADRLKKLPSGPSPSPSSLPFERRHSWSYDFNRGTLPSPSPTYSESHALITKSRSQRLPPSSMPRQQPDEYWGPHPPFSPSPSQSPPTYIRHVSKVLLRSESAPLSIPTRSNNNQMPPLSPPVKASGPHGNKIDARSGLIQTSSAADKLIQGVKDEARKLSRSPSRVSFQDDYDDSEFSGPFVVDEAQGADPGSRGSSYDKDRKKQEGAVGALICILNKAPPLHQHQELCEESSSSSSASKVYSSTKTTADALEELRGYTNIKNLLLNLNQNP